MTKKLKLYIEASPLAENSITGIPHVTAELTRALTNHPQHGKTFQVVLPIAYDKRKKLNRWEFPGARVQSIPLPQRILNLVWKYNLLPPMDILLGRGIYVFPNYKNWRLLHSKSLTYIHDLGYVRYPEFVQPKNLAFLRANVMRWICRTTVVLAGSEHTRQEIIDSLKVAPERVVSIYHGVDTAEYYPRSRSEVDNVKARYNIKGDYLLYIGSLEPRKNLVRLVQAYRNLPDKQRQRYGLLLVGSGGWLNEEILAAIKQAQNDGYNIIKPSEYVGDEDLPALYTGATLLVHPALYEGFGLSPLQAMACGTPAVVGNNSSLPEVVGPCGVQVNAEDTADISAKISTILSDTKLRETLSSQGIRRAATFSWERSAEAILTQAKRIAGLRA